MKIIIEIENSVSFTVKEATEFMEDMKKKEWCKNIVIDLKEEKTSGNRKNL